MKYILVSVLMVFGISVFGQSDTASWQDGHWHVNKNPNNIDTPNLVNGPITAYDYNTSAYYLFDDEDSTWSEITDITKLNDTLSDYYTQSQVDSADALRVLYTDTSSMLSTYITESEVNELNGWSILVDTTYPSTADSLRIAANTDVTPFAPDDITLNAKDSLWSTVDSTIVGFANGFSEGNFTFTAIATNASQYVDVWLDVNGTEKARQTFILKGIGDSTNVNYNYGQVFTSSWITNGATINIRSDQNVDINSMELNLKAIVE